MLVLSCCGSSVLISVPEETLQVTMEDDKGQSTVVLRDIREKCKDALTHIQGLVKKAEEGEFSTTKVSFMLNILIFRTPENFAVLNEPRREKTCLRGFRPGQTQTGLLSYRG